MNEQIYYKRQEKLKNVIADNGLDGILINLSLIHI